MFDHNIMMWATPINVKKILDDDDKEERYDDVCDDEKDYDNEEVHTHPYNDFHSIDYNAFQWLHQADQYICHDDFIRW